MELKLNVSIDMLRIGLVCDGYTLDDAIEKSDEEIIQIYNKRFESKIVIEYLKSLDIIYEHPRLKETYEKYIKNKYDGEISEVTIPKNIEEIL